MDLVLSLLKKDPDRRLVVPKVLKHKWMKLKVPEQAPIPIKPGLVRNLVNFQALNKFKRASLNTMVSMLPEWHIRTLRAIFISMDSNCDGTLSLGELRERMAKSAYIDAEKMDMEMPIHCNRDFTYTEFLAATFDRRRFLTDRICRA